MKKNIFKLSTGLLVLTLLGCNAGKNETNIELMQGMFDQISLKAQDWDLKRDGRPSQLVPPENTIPMGKYYYKFATAEEAEAELVNTFKTDNSPEFVKRGEKMYNVYCSMCHGLSGNSDGTVSDKLLLPPSKLNTPGIKAMSDARIFHIITKGRGLMGSYATQIKNPKDRWAIINHIRGMHTSK